MEHTLKPGDICADCQRMGLTRKLRYFYINFEEQVLKCENETCLYPHNDEVSSDSDEDCNPEFPQQCNIKSSPKLSDEDLLLEELLKDDSMYTDSNMSSVNTVAATVAKVADNSAAASMPLINMNLDDMEAVTLPKIEPSIGAAQTADANKESSTCLEAVENPQRKQKIKIEIQSIETIPMTPDAIKVLSETPDMKFIQFDYINSRTDNIKTDFSDSKNILNAVTLCGESEYLKNENCERMDLKLENSSSMDFTTHSHEGVNWKSPCKQELVKSQSDLRPNLYEKVYIDAQNNKIIELKSDSNAIVDVKHQSHHEVDLKSTRYLIPDLKSETNTNNAATESNGLSSTLVSSTSTNAYVSPDDDIPRAHIRRGFNVVKSPFKNSPKPRISSKVRKPTGCRTPKNQKQKRNQKQKQVQTQEQNTKKPKSKISTVTASTCASDNNAATTVSSTAHPNISLVEVMRIIQKNSASKGTSN